jgi:serine/threonine-protein kinase SRPK3
MCSSSKKSKDFSEKVDLEKTQLFLESSENTSENYSTSSDENIAQIDNLDLNMNILNKYNIICELGRGAFSIVWLAFNIQNHNFYALKVQNPSEFKDGLSEILFVQNLSIDPPVFNNLVEYFIEQQNDERYLCSVWELHSSNIDSLIRKGDFNQGFPLEIVKKIMKQLIMSIKILHTKFKVLHGDIKTDNILVKGINNKDKFIIEKYKESHFFAKYSLEKQTLWLQKGNNLDSKEKLTKDEKLIIRKKVHLDISKKILEEYEISDIKKYSFNSDYLKNINISLADFGTYCEEHNYYEESFGTRYYQAPEIILLGKTSYPVDIWALGCTFYELLSGKILFDPIKDNNYSRDYYHLYLMNETCGDFSSLFLKRTKHYTKFFTPTYKLKEYVSPTINRLDSKINELDIHLTDKIYIKELLLKMLNLDPNKRIDINDLFKHHYFI